MSGCGDPSKVRVLPRRPHVSPRIPTSQSSSASSITSRCPIAGRLTISLNTPSSFGDATIAGMPAWSSSVVRCRTVASTPFIPSSHRRSRGSRADCSPGLFGDQSAHAPKRRHAMDATTDQLCRFRKGRAAGKLNVVCPCRRRPSRSVKGNSASDGNRNHLVPGKATVVGAGAKHVGTWFVESHLHGLFTIGRKRRRCP